MSRREHLLALRQSAPVVLPSMLLCDFGNLGQEVARLEEAGVRGLHLDVMDGQFVPNFTYGMTIVDAFRRLTSLPLDVHLMINRPEQYIQHFYDAGADILTIHAEATDDLRGALAMIAKLDLGVGVAVNPDTPIESIQECLDLVDLVLIMSVQAGFGGQAFNPVALDKLRQVRQIAGDDVLLEIDGGINLDTIASCTEAGAELLVAGSAIFRKESYVRAVAELRDQALTAV